MYEYCYHYYFILFVAVVTPFVCLHYYFGCQEGYLADMCCSKLFMGQLANPGKQRMRSERPLKLVLCVFILWPIADTVSCLQIICRCLVDHCYRVHLCFSLSLQSCKQTLYIHCTDLPITHTLVQSNNFIPIIVFFSFQFQLCTIYMSTKPCSAHGILA